MSWALEMELTSHRAPTGTVARRDSDEFRMQRVLNDIAAVELERVVFAGGGFRRGVAGENNRGIERAGATGGAVRDKVNVGKLLGMAVERRWCRLFSGENGLLLWGEMLFDAVHLSSSVGQLGIGIIPVIVWPGGRWRNRIADQQQFAGEFIWRVPRGCEQM